MSTKSSHKPRNAFTLIEMVVVVVIIGIIAGISIVGYQSVVDRSRTEAQVVRNRSIAKEVAALVVLDSTLDYVGALDLALDDLPVAASPGVFADDHTVSGFRVTDEVPSDTQTTVSYRIDATADVMYFVTYLEPGKAVGCVVDHHQSRCTAVRGQAGQIAFDASEITELTLETGDLG